MTPQSPPPLAEWLLSRALARVPGGENIRADLREDFEYRLRVHGAWRARLWYWRAAAGVSFSYARRGAMHARSKRPSLMDALSQDVRFAARTLRKSPGFTAAALVTLMVGIGSSTAIFSVLNAVVLRPLPYADPERLMFLSEAGTDGRTMTISWPDFQDWTREQKSFEAIAAVGAATFNLTGDGSAERLLGRAVSWNFLDLLGVKPQLGRDFRPEDDQLGVEHRILISDGLWKRRFGGDPNVLGRQLTIDTHRHTIIGVLPPGFRYAGRNDDIYEPVTVRTGPNSPFPSRGNHNLIYALGRLREGVSEEAARAELEGIAASLEKMYPVTNAGVTAFVQPLARRIVGDLRQMVFAMFAAVGFLLLIACVNVTNLQVARGSARQHELAVRSALGSGRLRLMRQLLVESLLLAVTGGILAVGFGALMLKTLLALAPEGLPRVDEVALDGAALLFAFGAVLLAGVVFGTLPALQASRRTGQQALVRAGRNPGHAASTRLRRGLIVAETALALILLTGAGLMARTMQQLSAVDTGFDIRNIATVRFTISDAGWDVTRRRLFYDELEARARALPGITNAALAMSVPIDGSYWGSVFIVNDRPAPAPGDLPDAAFSPVTPSFFSTMGLRLIAGRTLQPGDRGDGAHAVVVNETLAKKLWPDGNAIGKRLKQGFADWQTPWREIVGIVEDVKLNGVDQETPLEVYTPLAQDTGRSVAIVARTSIDPKQALRSLTDLVKQMNGDLPVYDASTIEDLLSRSVARQRVTAAVLGVFAAIALLLAAVGLYGIVSHGVTERTPEIGVRLALGATKSGIVGLFLQNGIVTAAAGILLGGVGAYWLTAYLEDLLFGVKPSDGVAFAAGAGILFGVALIACYVPAARASRVSPTVALRGE